MTYIGRIASLVALALLSAMQAESAVEAFYDPERVAAIAAVSNPDAGPDLPYRSGLFVAFVAEQGGRVAYFRDESETFSSGALTESPSKFNFREPTAIAESGGVLVVWDAGDASLYKMDLRSGGARERLWQGRPLVAPSQIAISPDGFVLIVDNAGGSIFWTTLKADDFMGRLKGKTQSVSIAIQSWDTVAVLDRDLQSIQIFTLLRDKSGLVMRERGALSLAARGRLAVGEFQTIAAQDGALYVADRKRIYSYIESTGELVAAGAEGAELKDIRQMQVTYDNFFVIDGEHLEKVARTVPVELVFDTLPNIAQSALLDLYQYLDQRRLLPFDEHLTSRSYETLEALLIEQKVFAAPSTVSPEQRSSFSVWPFRREAPSQLVENEGYLGFEALFCERNGSFCAARDKTGVLGRPVNSGTRLMLPRSRLQSKLGLRDVSLQQPVSEYLDYFVISPELRARADFSVLRRFNESARNMDEKSFLAQSRGRVTLPYETWYMTVAVPVHDFNREDSALHTIGRHRGVSLFSRQVYAEQTAHSHHTEEARAATERCAALKEKHQQWFEDLNYPLDFDLFIDSKVRIGILESRAHLTRNHQVFELDTGAPTWHEPDGFDLVPQPVPASFGNGAQVVNAIDVFSRNLHHGTHVSALLAGRQGPCWSGLLPKSKLVLIDTSAPASISSGLFDANVSLVPVLNVSQKLADEPNLHELLTQRHRSQLFVLAAGNAGVDLNVDDDNSAVKWGTKENIIVVTAIDATQQPIGPTMVDGSQQPGVNAGKRFVDLAAPGSEIMSATGDLSYGPATGTSQAVPGVAAAAAYLADEEAGWARPPGMIKARMIATADWHPGLAGRVWGGIFNLGDAVRFPSEHLIRTHTSGLDKVFTISNPNNAKLDVRNVPVPLYERDAGNRFYTKRDIRLRQILSLKANDDGSFRVVFREQETRQLKIMLAAQLFGQLRCDQAREWDVNSKRWSPSDLCGTDIAVAQVKHYYQSLVYDVDWD